MKFMLYFFFLKSRISLSPARMFVYLLAPIYLCFTRYDSLLGKLNMIKLTHKSHQLSQDNDKAQLISWEVLTFPSSDSQKE